MKVVPPPLPGTHPEVPADDREVLATVLDRVQKALGNQFASGLSRLPGRPESWACVPSRTAVALTQLRLARRAVRAAKPRFLECGSGFAFVTAMARELDFTVTGIEIEPSYIEYSRRLFDVPVMEIDLLSYDGYGDFDVVFYYAPFADEAVAGRFERRVEEALRPGGVVCANYKITDDWTGGPFDLLYSDGARNFVLQKRE